jgi:hypothetical protein
MKDIAISEILAVILLIAVVTVSMGIIGVMITRDIIPIKVPHISFEACKNGTDIFLYHTGGDPLLITKNYNQFYVKLLDSDKKIMYITQFNSMTDEEWSSGIIKTVPAGLPPTDIQRVQFVQIIARSNDGGENLVGWTKVLNCSV